MRPGSASANWSPDSHRTRFLSFDLFAPRDGVLCLRCARIVTRDMWIKESLTLSPAELAEISVWFGLPWTVKMVFGELVDTIAPDWILPGRDIPTCAPMSAFNP